MSCVIWVCCKCYHRYSHKTETEGDERERHVEGEGDEKLGRKRYRLRQGMSAATKSWERQRDRGRTTALPKFRFPTSATMKEKISIVLSPQVCGIEGFFGLIFVF